jgi:Leucine-rich repeat (LRR) protein
MGAIDELPKLRHLDFRFARLRRIPKLSTLADHLETLDLRGNQIEDVGSIGKFSALRALSLGANRLSVLEDFGPVLAGLDALYLHKNSLEVLPTAAWSPRLRNLSLYRNEFACIPHEIGLCKSLVYLNAGANPLTSLPREIGDAHAIEELLLEHCHLPAIPPDILRLRHLHTVNVRGNPLTDVQALEALKESGIAVTV